MIEHLVAVRSKADGAAELRDQAAVIVQLAPAEKGGRRLVGIVISGSLGVQPRKEMLRLELDPSDIVGNPLYEPDRVVSGVGLNNMGCFMHRQAGILGLRTAPLNF